MEQCIYAIAWVNVLLCIVLIPTTNCNDMWPWYLVQFPFLTYASSLQQINSICVIPPTSSPWIMWYFYLIWLLLHARSYYPVMLCLLLISHEDIQGIFTPFSPEFNYAMLLLRRSSKQAFSLNHVHFTFAIMGKLRAPFRAPLKHSETFVVIAP